MFVRRKVRKAKVQLQRQDARASGNTRENRLNAGQKRPASAGLPDCVEDGAVDPLHYCARFVTEFWARWFAATDFLDFVFYVLEGTDREFRALDGIQQVSPDCIDGDTALGHDDVDHLSRPRECCDFVNDDRNAVAKRW